MTVEVSFTPKVGDKVKRVSPCGVAYMCQWVVCPICSKGRWVLESETKKPCFTGLCQKCNGIAHARKLN